MNVKKLFQSASISIQVLDICLKGNFCVCKVAVLVVLFYLHNSGLCAVNHDSTGM